MLDDVIERLGPSLKPHVGCNIIDLNPGPALWSSKLHEYLQPRSHVFVEPESRYHEPFLKPLLDAPGSRYHLRTWEPGESYDLQRYVSEGLVSSSQADKTASGGSTKRNDSVLVIANMTRGEKKRPGSRYTSSGRVQAFCSSLRRMDGLNSQGPVRMLMWLLDQEKHNLVPQTVDHRDKLSVLMDMCFHIEEIVTAGKLTRQRRDTFLDIESGKRVARRMKSAGIHIPQDRQEDTQKRVQEILAKSSSEDSITPMKDNPRDWEKELQKLEKAFENKVFTQFVLHQEPGWNQKGRPGRPSGVLTPEFKRLSLLRDLLRFVDKKKLTLDRLLEEENEIDALQSEILHGSLNQQEREAATIKRDQLYQSFEANVDSSATLVPKQLAFLGDNRRAFALDPPLLMWDRRGAEPLLAHEAEFYHHNPMSLLDFQPLAPSPYAMTMEQWIYFEHVFNNIHLTHGTRTMKDLQLVAPGAFEALVPLVPSLTDPRKGGRAKLDQLRVRCLTPEMARGLALAWEQWPLRPDLVDVIGSDRRLEDMLIGSFDGGGQGKM